tara:strand:+ start:947 stop:1969 length:1023 start_codon:yes stop_codon:yes gene_type:complete
MSELSGHNCPHCKDELHIQIPEESQGTDLLICKQCWGIAVVAKSMESIISNGKDLDEKINRGSDKKSNCKCPVCLSVMNEIELEIPKINRELSQGGSSSIVTIDSCNNCPTFWFDAGELDLLNRITPKSDIESQIDRIAEVSLDQNSHNSRKNFSMALGVCGFFVASTGGPILFSLGLLIIIGAIIGFTTKNPEHLLAKGICSKCLGKDVRLAWICQRGGCWSQICSDCQAIEDDPIEAYAELLGSIAIAIVGVGAMAVVGPLGIGELLAKAEDTKVSQLLLCKKCEKDLLPSDTIIPKPITKNDELIISDGYCNFIDLNTKKKCRRVIFRKLHYCYMHK